MEAGVLVSEVVILSCSQCSVLGARAFGIFVWIVTLWWLNIGVNKF
jgi:hypothetical protein